MLPGGQQDQGYGVVLHDQGKDYQQPKTFMSGSPASPETNAMQCRVILELQKTHPTITFNPASTIIVAVAIAVAVAVDFSTI